MKEEKDLDLEFDLFLKKLREKLMHLAKNNPIILIIISISNTKIKIYVRTSYNHYSLKKTYYTNLGKRLIAHLTNCKIPDPPDYDLPIGFKMEDGNAYYFICNTDIKKI